MNLARKSVTNDAPASSHRLPPEFQMQAGNLLIGGLFGGLALANTREIFARNLKFWLKKRELSGAELARRLETDPSTVSHWLRETTGPDLATIGRVAETLQIPAWYLLHESGSKMPDGFAPPPVPSTDEAERVLRSMADLLGKEIRTIRPKRPS